MHHQYLSPSLQLYSHSPLCFSTQLNLLWVIFYFFFLWCSLQNTLRRSKTSTSWYRGGTPIALQRLWKNFVTKERMFVVGKQIKRNKIKKVLQMIYFFMMVIWWLCVCVCVFSSYKSFYFVSKERMFVAGKQIKNNKIKRVLQMINFFFSYKSFCSVIVYDCLCF
jgi:hypothetical protein